MSPATAQRLAAATGYRNGGRPNDGDQPQITHSFSRDAYGRVTVAGLKAGDYRHYVIADFHVQLAWNAHSETFFVSTGTPGNSTLALFSNLRAARKYFADACRKARHEFPNNAGAWLH